MVYFFFCCDHDGGNKDSIYPMTPTLLTNLFQVSMGFLIYFSLTAVSKVNPVIDYFFKKMK
nr:hypothetical protein [Enterococcus durans]